MCSVSRQRPKRRVVVRKRAAIIVQGAETRIFRIDRLATEREQFQGCFSGANRIDFRALTRVSEKEFDAVLDILQSVPSCPPLGVEGNEKTYSSPIELVLSELTSAASINVAHRYLDFACQAVAKFELAACDLGTNQICDCVEKSKIAGVTRRTIKAMIKGYKSVLLGTVETTGPSVLMRSIWDSAPVSGAMVVPPGWTLSERGVLLGGTAIPAITTKLAIKERLVDHFTRQESLVLIWQTEDGKWREKVVDRKTISSKSTIVKLSGCGIAVTSLNAELFVEYLADLLVANITVIPIKKRSPHFGWQGDPHEGAGFLVGADAFVDASGEILDPWDEGCDDTVVRFVPADAGEEQLSQSLRKSGEYEPWIEAMRPLACHPKVQFAVYAALSSILIDVFRAPITILDLCGPTSGGKSITLQIAASVFGNPSDSCGAALIYSWNNTFNWQERRLTALHSLPLFCDEAQVVTKPGELGRCIYMIANGQGRGRGSLDGTRASGAWRNVVLSTGEQPLHSTTKQAGAKSRILTLWGSPFEGRSADLVRTIHEVRDAVCENYGHAGRKFAAYVLRNRDRWREWRTRFERLRQRYVKRAGGNGPMSRMAGSLALVQTTASIARHALDLPWQKADFADLLWTEMADQATEADAALMALKYVVQWAQANMPRFEGKVGSVNSHERSRLVGSWFDGNALPDVRDTESYDAAKSPSTIEVREFGTLSFLSDQLKEILTEGDFLAAAILKTFKDRGWVKLERDKTQYPKRKFQGVPTRMVTLTPKAILVALA